MVTTETWPKTCKKTLKKPGYTLNNSSLHTVIITLLEFIAIIYNLFSEFIIHFIADAEIALQRNS